MSAVNVLYITIDQWRSDCLGYLGNDVIQTPNLDALCADSVSFANHYSCSAPCGPSRATLHTGMYPSNHRSIRNGTPLDYSLTNMAKEARAAGYDPVLFGYTDSTPDPRVVTSKDPTFRTYENVLPGFTVGAQLATHSRPWLSYLKSKGYDVERLGYSIYDADPDFKLPEGRHISFAPARFKAEHSETAWLTDRVLDYITLPDDGAFFHHVSYLRPHPPFIAPPEYHRMYDPAAMPLPIGRDGFAGKAALHPFLDYAFKNTQSQKASFNGGEGRTADLSQSEIQQIRAIYYALVSEADANIGRLINQLKAQGSYDNTLIIVTSDHGEQLGDHYLFGKLGFFDQSYHIPLIVKPPHTECEGRGEIVDAFSESVDIMPTILDYMGRSVPAQCDGRSLAPFIDDSGPEKWRDAVHWLFDFRDPLGKKAENAFSLDSRACNMMVLRDQDYKYVHFAGLPALLFDVKNDPNETVDLASDPAHQKTLLHYAQAMMSWRMQHEYGALDGLTASKQGLRGEE